MYKIYLATVAVALVACAHAQLQAQPEANAAPEPYAYAYETDTHAASEQRDPNGAVTGFYTLTDADGRARRVDYVADEAGFRAKVQTNEVGTKQANSADVEVLASPPTEGQLVYQAGASGVQGQAVAQQAGVLQSQLLRQQAGGAYTTTTGYQQIPAGYRMGYGYNTGYGNGAYAGYPGQAGYRMGSGYTGTYTTGYPGQAGYGYRMGYGGYGNQLAGYGNQLVGYSTGYQPGYQGSSEYRYTSSSLAPSAGNYNYHTPASYYSAVGQQQPATGAIRYQTTGAAQQQAATGTTSSGSSNYIVLKSKREAAEKKSE